MLTAEQTMAARALGILHPDVRAAEVTPACIGAWRDVLNGIPRPLVDYLLDGPRPMTAAERNAMTMHLRANCIARRSDQYVRPMPWTEFERMAGERLVPPALDAAAVPLPAHLAERVA